MSPNAGPGRIVRHIWARAVSDIACRRSSLTIEMLKRRSWRSVVHQVAAVTILMSVSSVGAVALAPWSSAATQTSPTRTIQEDAVPNSQPSANFVGGKHPHSPLCQAVRRADLALGNTLNRKLRNWREWQNFLLAYDDELSKDSQAVIQVGTDVPANVRTTARKEVSNLNAFQKLVRKAKSTDGLNASTKAAGISLLGSLSPVLDYVGDQCGSEEQSFPLAPLPVIAKGPSKAVSGTGVPVTTSTLS